MEAKNRGNFGTKVGAVLAAAGSAIGLGNVWRFPYETGANGGAAFLIIYLCCVLIIGVPLMVAEFAVGRRSRTNSYRAFPALGATGLWKYVGGLCVLTGTLILCYYGVVQGWTIEYVVQAGINGLADKTPEDYTADFNNFVSDPVRPLIYLFVSMALTLGVILMGVQKGIERASKVMMPMLFVFIIVLVGCSVTLPGAMDGIKFMLYPDFSKVTPATFLAAMGQAFFSLSIGMGCLCTYASYFPKEANLFGNALNIAGIDTLIAILSGLIIFPAAYAVGIEPGAGPSLVFITLPNVFYQAFGQWPWLAYIFSLMFYLLLAMAALTSAISLLEPPTLWIHEEFRIRRRYAAPIATVFCVLVGVACSLSMGVWGGYKIFGMTLFDFFDFTTAKIMLPLGGLFIALFVGWKMNTKDLLGEISNDRKLPQSLIRFYYMLVRFLLPLAIALIFLNELGLFSFL
ncbi:MAG: sodium-dependent transporter [Bacteroidaceae bacterium]|nr:sodium-dependent transporter [Bacteroidaceae bacterium]